MSLDTDTRNPRLLRVEFILDTSHPIGQASGVGSFNGWTPGLNGLLPEPDGTLSVTIGLPYGQRIVFRHLGPGDEWFDERDADEITEEGPNLYPVEAA